MDSQDTSEEMRKRYVVLDCQLRKEKQSGSTKDEAIEKLLSFAEVRKEPVHNLLQKKYVSRASFPRLVF